MRPSLQLLLVLGLVSAAAGDSSERLDDFSDLSMDGGEDERLADTFSQMSDDEFLSGGGGGAPLRPGEAPASSAAADKASFMLRIVSAALKRPGMTKRFGQILPILRVMSPPQRLALAALVMQQVMVPTDVTEKPLQAAMRMGATPDASSNLTTSLLLPLSADIAAMFRGTGLEAQARSSGARAQVPRWRNSPPLPPAVHPAGPPRGQSPQGPPRLDRLQPPPPGVNRRNALVAPSIDMMPPPLHGRPLAATPPPAPGSPPTRQVTTKPPQNVPDRKDHHACSLFSDTVCASVENYPEEAILASIYAEKHTLGALLADSAPVVQRELQRRQDDDDYPPGHQSFLELDNRETGADAMLCPSIIKYARPQRARATSGQWKYIVNTADHTQTLRLEKCTRVDEQCSFVSDRLRSHCSQVYNYHRLLTWDKEQGLHMDIFKVPTCCSCQVRPPAGLLSRQPQGEYSDLHETVVPAENGRAVPPPYSNTEGTTDSSSTKPYPFRKPATRRPPLQQQRGNKPKATHGLQALDEGATAQDLLPRFPPLPLQNEFEYPPLAGRRVASVRNRTRAPAPVLDDLTAEGSERRPIPVLVGRPGISGRPAPAATPAPTPIVSKGTASTSSAKRINYSYHPIIDFFRPMAAAQEARNSQQSYAGPGRPHSGPPPPPPQAAALEQRQNSEDSWSPLQSEWSPIT